MLQIPLKSVGLPPALEQRTEHLWQERLLTVHRQTDQLFAGLMILQWFAGIAAALWISPRTWAGLGSATHLHVWTALLLGGALSGFPVALALLRPGTVASRHVIAAAQMLTSALLIHLCGGRIETHFHVFGSLAFLAFYRDWKVLATAVAVIATDHFLRSTFWPESVFGVLAAARWRWLEHGGWVLFEVLFLSISCHRNLREMQADARRHAQLEFTHEAIEGEVARRTTDLLESRHRQEQSEKQFRLAVEAAPNGMVMVSAEGNILMLNGKMEEMFGYSRAELIGAPIEILVPHRYRAGHPELRLQYAQHPQTRAMGIGREVTGVRKDGTEFPVELGLNPVETEEGIMVLAAVVDITQRKGVELQVQQTLQELERKNRELDEFTYVASHDLQEPIRKLVSFSKLLQQDIGTELNDAAQRDLGFIVDAALRMKNLVQDLLALSRAGRSAMKVAPLDLAACVERALDALEIRVRETGAQIEIDPLPTVDGDATVLAQLYQNLIGNALKFLPKDRSPAIRLTAERDGERWILGVKDNGIGIKAEYSERIFRPFQRLHGRHEYEGTGIGLAICKKSVERHGGEIWVESQPGEGCHFKFTLPVKREHISCETETNEAANELSFC